ncbi:MAG: fibronectin type III-like domain-contianing protein [Kiritimatiellae bacterium]|nr:fibronectin type III-like domain-contianing protein [Kiritimatiellia bacterium]
MLVRVLPDWPAHKLGELSYPGVWPEPVVKDGKEDKGEPRQEYLDGIWVGYRGFDKYGIEPRYPFGHGLSYTTWKVKCCQCENVANTNVANDQLELDIGNGNNSTMATLVKVSVSNTGKMAGRRAVLLFASKPPQDGVEMPKKELVAFESVCLKPGESTTVEFKVGFEELKYWSDKENRWLMPNGNIKFTAE